MATVLNHNLGRWAANWRSKNWSRSKEEIEWVPAPAALRQHRAHRPALHPSSGEEAEVGVAIEWKSLSPHHRAEGQTGRHSSVLTPAQRRPSTGHAGGEKSPLHLCFGALAKSRWDAQDGQYVITHWEPAHSATSQELRALPAGWGLERCSPHRKELIISHQPTSPTTITTKLLSERKETTSTKWWEIFGKKIDLNQNQIL